MELVERDAALQVLGDCLRSVAQGTGQTALIAGEAGVGKTSLLKALAANRGEADLWWGNCDALQTPHPLAPLHDIARSSEVRFSSLLGADSDRAALFEAVLTDLRQSRRPTLAVIEDAHWADDATLDLLKFLGRRIDRAACLLVISYRDDEVGGAREDRALARRETASGVLSRIVTSRLTLPRSVNLTALCSKFTSNCRKRTGSPCMRSGNRGGTVQLTVTGLSRAVTDIKSIASAPSARRSMVVMWSASLPASMRDRSSTSSMSASKDVPER